MKKPMYSLNNLQAQELATAKQNYPNLDWAALLAPISEDDLNHYCFVTINLRDNEMRTAKIANAKRVFKGKKHIEQNRLPKNKQTAQFMFASTMALMVHNPNKDSELLFEKYETKARMTDSKKEAIKEAFEAGKAETMHQVNELAKTVNVGYDAVVSYIAEL